MLNPLVVELAVGEMLMFTNVGFVASAMPPDPVTGCANAFCTPAPNETPGINSDV